ncbi:MAG: ABC transporter ATP-binding protein [Rhodothermales bacterium]|nr:ABC transporter ATP-binding protein [Rhodothermales bacterium]MBO6781499.1 ABC transporter ATP-binding protein [Rhodothermales bacterium]
MSEFAIHARGLHKRFADVHAVAGVDFEVLRGECFGLLGPNGAGKTTSIEILEGLQRADEGEVSLLGLSWDRDEHTLRQRMGIQLQETRLPDKLTVREAVTLFRSFYRAGRTVDEVLSAVALHEKADAWVVKLSGGQKQRLAVACALVGAPDLLFLDEPTTGLDPQSRRQLWDIVQEFQRGGGTVLLTTHYMDEAYQLCDRVAIMDHGRIIALDTPDGLIDSLGASHVVEFQVEGGELAKLETLPGVEHVTRDAEEVRLTVSGIHVAVPALMNAVSTAGLKLTELRTHTATLEDVFLHHTGRHLRDA